MIRKLLLIDDDPFALKMLEEFFRNEWKIVTETTLEMIEKRIQTERPNLFLLNLSNRSTDGEMIFDTIQNRAPGVPVIVYAASSHHRLGRSLVKKGAFWNLTMPLNIDDLAHVVRMAMVLQDQEQMAQQARHDFDQLEQGIAKMFLPLSGSFPANFTFDQDDLIQGIIDLLADILKVEKASLMLLNPNTGEMRIKAARGLSPYVVQNTVKRVGEGIAGWVAQEGRPLLIKDVQRDPQFSESAFYHQYTTRSLICCPLKLGDRVIGVLSANNKTSGEPFDEEDLYLGTIFSHLLLLTLHSVQLHFDRERQLLRETEIGNLNRKITATLEPKVLFHLLLNECCSIFHAEFGLVFDLGDRTDECAIYFLNGTRFTETALPLASLRQWASTRSRPSLASAGSERGELKLVRQVLQQEIRSWVSAPLVLQDKLTGSLELASFDPMRFREADKHSLSRVGQQAALAVSNARLYMKLLNSIKEISDARKEIDKARRGQFL